jgi:anti-sigma regulatory factor (Ser/Thr protein kinase)
MPLGLMPGMPYDEKEAWIAPGESMLLYSDGIVEAHSPQGEMYGFGRVRADVAGDLAGTELIDNLLDRLHAFVGRGWEQEDDITMVALRRGEGNDAFAEGTVETQVLAEFELPGALGNERVAMDRVADAVALVGLSPGRLERLKTAVSETAMNAIEYGSAGDPSVPVRIRVDRAPTQLQVRIADAGLGGAIPHPDDAEQPDLEAKLAGLQKARGWGLFLIQQMVDRVDIVREGERQTVVLTLDLGGASDGQPA